MVKMILVSHGNLAEAMLKSAQMIVGHQEEGMVTLGLQPGESPDELQDEIESALKNFGSDEILLMSDLISGTPFNVAGSLMQKYKFRHICGFNLAMLLEALMLRGTLPVDELCESILSAFSASVLDVNTLLDEQEQG
ncbi:MAG: hypothetical protein WA110_08425 [Anaerolineaceae bacterium]